MQHKQCLVFGGRRGLDPLTLRQSVSRIPEVSKRIKEAQTVIDEAGMGIDATDLFNTLNGQDGDFINHPKMRTLLAAIVQTGLADRYKRHFGTPQFLVGSTNSASAMSVLAGRISFKEMVEQSPWFQNRMEKPEPENWESAPINTLTLAGVSLEEFGILELNEQDMTYDDVASETKDCYQLLSQINLDSQVDQFIHIGPALDFRLNEMSKRKIFEFSLGDSVEMDPILNSFWKTAEGA